MQTTHAFDRTWPWINFLADLGLVQFFYILFVVVYLRLVQVFSSMWIIGKWNIYFDCTISWAYARSFSPLREVD